MSLPGIPIGRYDDFLRDYVPPKLLLRTVAFQVCQTHSRSEPDADLLIYVYDVTVTRQQHDLILRDIRKWCSSSFFSEESSLCPWTHVYLKFSEADRSEEIVARQYYILTPIVLKSSSYHSLRSVTESGRMTIQNSFGTFVSWFLELGSCLWSLHALGLPHRNVNWLSIFVDLDGSEKLYLGPPGFGFEFAVDQFDDSDGVLRLDPRVFDEDSESEGEGEGEGEGGEGALSGSGFDASGDVFSLGSLVELLLRGFGEEEEIADDAFPDFVPRPARGAVVDLLSEMQNAPEDQERPTLDLVLVRLRHIITDVVSGVLREVATQPKKSLKLFENLTGVLTPLLGAARTDDRLRDDLGGILTGVAANEELPLVIRTAAGLIGTQFQRASQRSEEQVAVVADGEEVLRQEDSSPRFRPMDLEDAEEEEDEQDDDDDDVISPLTIVSDSLREFASRKERTPKKKSESLRQRVKRKGLRSTWWYKVLRWGIVVIASVIGVFFLGPLCLSVTLVYFLLYWCCSARETLTSSPGTDLPLQEVPSSDPVPTVDPSLPPLHLPLADSQPGLSKKKSYKVRKVIGSGAQSSVYLCEKDGIEFVMKRYKPGTELEFALEVAALQQFDHTNVVKMFDHFGFTDEYGEEQLFIILEYLDGPDLRKRLRRFSRRNKRLPFETAMSYIKQIVAGLVEIHAKSVVHHDGRCVIGDFGFAVAVGDATVGLSGGTLKYMSPEATKGEIGHTFLDIWSCGTIIAELLTTRLVDFKMKSEKEAKEHIVTILSEFENCDDLEKSLSECFLRETASRTNAKKLKEVVEITISEREDE